MADRDSYTHANPKNAIAIDCGKPQQGADCAGLAAVATSAPCDVPAVTITSTQILRLPELLARLGVCRATIYLHISKGSFPKPIALGPRAVGWLEHEIDAWLAAKMLERKVVNKN